MKRWPRRMTFGRWAWLALAALDTLACQPQSDEAQITRITLAQGEFRSLAWGGAQVERFYVVARRGADDEAVIWSPDQPKTCSLGAVDWYSTTQPLRSGGLAWGALGSARIPVIDMTGDDKRGTLRFAGVDCKLTPLAIEGVNRSELWLTYDKMLVSPTYVSHTGDQRLVFADPASAFQRSVGSDVSAVAPIDQGVWAIEGGQAVLRDTHAAEQERLGHGVTDLAILNQDEVAYVGDGALWLWSAERGQKRLATDACSPRAVNGLGIGAVAYFSPCKTRRLVIDDTKGSLRTIADGVIELVSTSGWLVYTVQGDSSVELWLSAMSARAGGASADGGAPPSKAQSWPLGSYDAFDLGQLWQRGPGLLLLSSLAADGSLTLFDIDTAAAKKTIQEAKEGRGLVSLRSGNGNFATVASDGTLLLRRLSDLRVELRASGVQRSSPRFMFSDDYPGFGYIDDVDPDTGLGSLELFLAKTGERKQIATRVREYREVWWPETGVVYSTGPGKGEGLYFARVEVPCQSSGNSVWACYF